uniref:Reverse transcriptase domain-containing protein n=1 Tax=Haemonchus contortus TaxID=6289 RepID=A0A7I5ECZ2_HAECO
MTDRLRGEGLDYDLYFQPSTSRYDEELEALYTDLERLYREGHTSFKATVGDSNASIAPEGRLMSSTWNGMESTPSMVTRSSRTPLICDGHESHLYSHPFDSHVYLPTRHFRQDEYIAPSVLPSEIRHAITMKNCAVPGPDRIKPEHLKNLPPVIVRTLSRLFRQHLSECPIRG